MRNILYKAKRKNWKELPKDQWWVCGDLIHEPFGTCVQVIRDGCRNKYKVDESTICQYTGLHDGTKWEQLSEVEQEKFLSEWNAKENRKNQKEDWIGKEIWENDIVAFLDIFSTESGYAERDCIGKVGWESEELCFYVTGRLQAESWEVLQECYVLGNIFDNPELLKGGAE